MYCLNRRVFLLAALALFSIWFVGAVKSEAQELSRDQITPERGDLPEQTNFVFFLVDDLGWADVGCFGSSFHETPNIDALCTSGMKFTHGYAASPVCSPTRASIMTGRHPVRVDVTDWLPGAQTENNELAKFKHVDDRDDLALEEVTIAEVLKENGYQNFFAGKWHLGPETHWPLQQGFDFNVGGCEKGAPPGGYYAPWNNPSLTAHEEGEYLTERLTEESIEFLKSRDQEKPFMLYLSYYNVHTPITPFEKLIEHFREEGSLLFGEKVDPINEHDGISRSRQDNPGLASMVAAVDESVGAVLDQLKESGLDENTVVIFFSDNGGLSTLRNRPGPGCNLPLRSGKGWLYEGGVREPTIIRAPGVTSPGMECEVPVVSMDFFPTMLQLASLDQRPDLHKDGLSLVPLMNSGASSTDEQVAVLQSRTMFWHYPHYHGSAWTPGASIRDGDWKLIEFYHYENYELYNLGDDPGEQSDLSESAPEKANELREKLKAWQTASGARMPEAIDR